MFLCATEDKGLLVFNADYTYSGQYLPQASGIDLSTRMVEGMALDDSQYLFSTNSGLFLCDLLGGALTRILDDEIDFSSFIIGIGEDHLLASLSLGLVVISYERKKGGSIYSQLNRPTLQITSLSVQLKMNWGTGGWKNPMTGSYTSIMQIV